MDKSSSQSDDNRKPGNGEPGRVASLPLHRQLPEEQPTRPGALDKIHDDEMRKDFELLARMREQIEQLPEIDAARIVQIHERILRGEYEVNGERLARKLGLFEADIQDSSSS